MQPVLDKLAAQFLLKRDGCTGDAFIAVYKSIKAALAAVAALHGKEVAAAGAGGKKGGKRGGESAAVGGTARLWARQLSGEGLHQKRWRLIVRNLPFNVRGPGGGLVGGMVLLGCARCADSQGACQCLHPPLRVAPQHHCFPAVAHRCPTAPCLPLATEAQLRGAFEPAGFVWELTLPRSASGRGRGFAFVGFTCKAHAERGIKLVNGQAVAGRPVAVDWAVAKAQYGSQQAAAAAEPEAVAEAGGKAVQRGAMDSDLEGSSDEEEGGAAAALVSTQGGWAGGGARGSFPSMPACRGTCSMVRLRGLQGRPPSSPPAAALSPPAPLLCRATRRRGGLPPLWSRSRSGACWPA